MKTLTIMTPTYNRRPLLARVYRSLTAQTSRDFVWMIVDDGSTDGTAEAVRSFAEEGIVDIVYFRKPNGGKHTTINLAFKEAKTELIAISLDSDDVFTPDAVEKILSEYFAGGKEFPGYVFLKGDASGAPHVNRLDPTLHVESWQRAVSEGRFDAEAVIVLKSAYARRFSFPVISGEKFFTEGYLWLQMTEPFFWSHEVICRGDYMSDGYSKNIIGLFKSAPRSYMMYNNLRMSLWKNPVKRFKYAVYYDGFALAAHEKKIISGASSKALAILAFPLGIAQFLYLKIKK